MLDDDHREPRRAGPDNIKRMLAYSSIAHAGYALVGFVAGTGAPSPSTCSPYAVINIGAFAIVALRAAGRQRTKFDDYAGSGSSRSGSRDALALHAQPCRVPIPPALWASCSSSRPRGMPAPALVVIGVLNSAERPCTTTSGRSWSTCSSPQPSEVSNGRRLQSRPGPSPALPMSPLGVFLLGLCPKQQCSTWSPANIDQVRVGEINESSRRAPEGPGPRPVKAEDLAAEVVQKS